MPTILIAGPQASEILVMPFSPERYDRLMHQIRCALVSTQITDWERGFLRDMKQKLERFGPGTRLTNKQYRRLMQVTRDAHFGRPRSKGFGTQAAGTAKGTSRSGSARVKRRGWLARLVGPALLVLVAGPFLLLHAVERFPEHVGPVVS